METYADKIINGLGGTTAVAKMLNAPASTVHSWRRNGIPPSRLAHLRLAAQVARLPSNVFDEPVAERAVG